MPRSFINSWTATGSPTTFTCSTRSYENGRTTTITIARMAGWAARHRTNVSSPKHEPACHRRPSSPWLNEDRHDRSAVLHSRHGDGSSQEPRADAGVVDCHE